MDASHASLTRSSCNPGKSSIPSGRSSPDSHSPYLPPFSNLHWNHSTTGRQKSESKNRLVQIAGLASGLKTWDCRFTRSSRFYLPTYCIRPSYPSCQNSSLLNLAIKASFSSAVCHEDSIAFRIRLQISALVHPHFCSSPRYSSAKLV